MTDNNKIVETLRTETETNKAAAAMFYVFALRERSAFTITVNSLMIAMKAEKFLYPREDYVKVLKLMANLGLGTLLVTSRGRVRALTGIGVTLKSLGTSVTGKGPIELKSYKQRHKFEEVQDKTNKRQHKLEVIQNALKLTMYINNKAISVDLPNGLTRAEMLSVITNITGIK